MGKHFDIENFGSADISTPDIFILRAVVRPKDNVQQKVAEQDALFNSGIIVRRPVMSFTISRQSLAAKKANLLLKWSGPRADTGNSYKAFAKNEVKRELSEVEQLRAVFEKGRAEWMTLSGKISTALENKETTNEARLHKERKGLERRLRAIKLRVDQLESGVDPTRNGPKSDAINMRKAKNSLKKVNADSN